MSGLPSPNMASLAAMGQGMPNAVVNSQAMYGNSMNPNERKKAVHVKVRKLLRTIHQSLEACDRCGWFLPNLTT